MAMSFSQFSLKLVKNPTHSFLLWFAPTPVPDFQSVWVTAPAKLPMLFFQNLDACNCAGEVAPCQLCVGVVRTYVGEDRSSASNLV